MPKYFNSLNRSKMSNSQKDNFESSVIQWFVNKMVENVILAKSRILHVLLTEKNIAAI